MDMVYWAVNTYNHVPCLYIFSQYIIYFSISLHACICSIFFCFVHSDFPKLRSSLQILISVHRLNTGFYLHCLLNTCPFPFWVSQLKHICVPNLLWSGSCFLFPVILTLDVHITSSRNIWSHGDHVTVICVALAVERVHAHQPGVVDWRTTRRLGSRSVLLTRYWLINMSHDR